MVAVILIALALFVLVLASLGFQPKLVKRMAGVLLCFVALAGTALYGFGFAHVHPGKPALAAVRTLFAVFCMFLGRNEISAIKDVPPLNEPVYLVVIYLVHLTALYCTASAVVSTIGARLMRTVNLLLIRRGKLNLIYGVSPEAVRFGGELLAREGGKAVFVGAAAPAEDTAILQMGASLLQGEYAGTPGRELLRRIGMGPERRLAVFCIDEDPAANLRFAKKLADALAEKGIAPAHTSLSLILPDAAAAEELQARQSGRGYGSVLAFERQELLARLALRAVPPWQTLRFDKNGRALGDFEALIVGFGRTGQALLRALLVNGQFAGSRFRATIIAQDHERTSGEFFSRYPGIAENYELRFLDADARSVEAYEILKSMAGTLCWASVCTGDARTNNEVAGELFRLFDRLGVCAPVVQCDSAGVRVLGGVSEGERTLRLLMPELLCSAELDDMAIRLNHRYHAAEGGTAQEHWAACDYFSRMSCRAAADFADAFFRAAGTDRARAAKEGFAPGPELLDALGETEHLRWCAFHYAMGYRTMPRQVWEQRARLRAEELRRSGQSELRIGKDTQRRLHACLIPWSELDELAAREREATGYAVDYRRMDLDNVELLTGLAASVQREAEHET